MPEWLKFALITTWVGVAVAVTVCAPRTRGALAYRLSGDPVFYWVGRFFTALHWPLIVIVAVPFVLIELVKNDE